MSAFIVEDAVINSVVSFLATTRKHDRFEYHDVMGSELLIDMSNPKEVEALGVAMFELNCNAVEQRYGAGEAKTFRELDYKFKVKSPASRAITPVAGLQVAAMLALSVRRRRCAGKLSALCWHDARSVGHRSRYRDGDACL